MAEPVPYLSSKLTELSRKLTNAHVSSMSIYNRLDDVHGKISIDKSNLKHRVEELMMRLWKKEHLSHLTPNAERKAPPDGTNQEPRLIHDETQEVTLRATGRRKQRITEHVLPAFNVPAIVVNDRKYRERSIRATKGGEVVAAENLNDTIDTYEETIRRLEESHVLMSREIEGLKEALCLQSAGIDLHIEASGVWTDVEA